MCTTYAITITRITTPTTDNDYNCNKDTDNSGNNNADNNNGHNNNLFLNSTSNPYLSNLTVHQDVYVHNKMAMIPSIKLEQGKSEGLIAATGLVILLTLDSNRPFFCPCDLGIWLTTKKKQ